MLPSLHHSPWLMQPSNLIMQTLISVRKLVPALIPVPALNTPSRGAAVHGKACPCLCMYMQCM